MARSNANASEIGVAGLSLVADGLGAAWVDGFAIPNDGDQRTFFMCKNSSAAPITLTVQTTATRDGLPVADRTYTVAAGDRLLVGPFRPHVFNRPDGTIWVDFSAVTDVTFQAFRLNG